MRQYSEAVEQFKQRITDQVEAQFSQGILTYTLKQCVSHGWIRLNGPEGTKIRSFFSKSTHRVRIPDILLLAEAFNLGQFEAVVNIRNKINCVHDKIFIDHYCKGLNSG